MEQYRTQDTRTETHLGQHITGTTDHTEASGILQGFRHGAVALIAGNIMRDEWVTGRREATITLLPGQEIIAKMGDRGDRA